MLRELKTKKLGLQIVPFSVTSTSTPTIAAALGADDIASLSREGAGDYLATFKEASAREMIVVAQAQQSNGGFTYLNSAIPTSTVASIACVDGAASGADGTSDGLAFRYLSANTDIVKPQLVKCTLDKPRITWGKISSAGAVSIGVSDFSVSKSATGVYVISFKRGFGRTPGVLITPIISSGARGAKVTLKSAKGCTVTMADNAGSAADAGFYICVCGTDSSDLIGSAKSPLFNSQRHPRIVPGRFLLTSTTPSITVNVNDFGTPTRTGAGDYTINLTQAFKREFAFFANPRAAFRVIGHTGGSGSIRFRTTNAAGSDTELTTTRTIDFFCIGSEDASEY